MTALSTTFQPRDLLVMNASQLDGMFGAGEAGPIPSGDADGVALLAPGTQANTTIARFVHAFCWKGKTFHADRGILTNRLTPFGLHDVVALVYPDASWFDGKPCIALDYSKTSIPARFIRDEIRRVGPGTYIGKVYLGRRPAFHFALEFR